MNKSNLKHFLKGDISWREFLQVTGLCNHDEGYENLGTHKVCPSCRKIKEI